MTIQCHMGQRQRLARITAGLILYAGAALVILHHGGMASPWAWSAIAAGTLMLVTGLRGQCPVSSLIQRCAERIKHDRH